MTTTTKKTKRNSLLGISNAKTSKGESLNVLTGILYLAPHSIAGRNVCPFASTGCIAACLYKAGRGAFTVIQKARIKKTELFHANPRAFVEMLAEDIAALAKRAKKLGMTAAIRLNGTSDLPWENLKGELGISLMERFPEVAFYDYTKNPNRATAYGTGKLPTNYHITFSRSESNAAAVLSVLDTTCNIAAVFDTKKGQPLPATWAGREVIDGDITDVRFFDKTGVIVGLRAKGNSAKKDTSGFIISTK